MRKRILLIGYNYYPEPTGIGKYNGEMVAWLAKNGYECEVITSYPYYPQWRVSEGYKNRKYWYSTEFQNYKNGSIKVNRCPMYVPSTPTSIKRILLDLSFLLTASIKLIHLLFQKKFDYVITVVPCFQFGLLGVIYKKIRKSILLYHIQDMQIEAARDLNMITSRWVINTLFKMENYILYHSDVISSISDIMVQKVRIKANKRVYLFANWTDCRTFYPIRNNSKIKEEYGFQQSDKVLLYSGAIGEKQGLEAIIHAAKAMKEQTEVKFIICGTGPYIDKLRQLTENLDITNLFFFPLQPLNSFNKFLNMADAHLIIQKANASDLVMPSKLANVLGVGGLAVITAKKGTGLHQIVSHHEIGILVEPEDQQALNQAIREAIAGIYDNMRDNARLYAKANLSIDQIMSKYESYVLGYQKEIENISLQPISA